MSEYRLFIDGREAEMLDDEVILFQKQRTDYTNPTIVRNSFSKTIKLPGTKANNLIFNEIWKLDKVQFDGAFNASKRTPFILTRNGSLMETGYMKLNNVIWNGKWYDYDITLFGEMGAILYRLSYSVNDETNAVEPLTLADLDFGFNGFTINRSFVSQAWNYLKTGQGNANFGKINFCVSYDGVPTAKNFDAKKIWCSTDRNIFVIFWNGKKYGISEDEMFPESVIDDGTRYKAVSTQISRMDPDDHYGLMEEKNAVTPVETRDLRSYLLRPVISISAIFDAISGYLNENMGYTLDMSDPFFISDEFKETWMTLPMLYEIDENVESHTSFTKEQLLSKTSSPAKYLISYCKIYGIYIDIDVVNMKVVLRRIPTFFSVEDNQELRVDLSREVKINPLSFDKATYIFDYADGDGEFYKKYKDAYAYKYGTQRVNTGYNFAADEAPYISNNVFRAAVDALEQSVYYDGTRSKLGDTYEDRPVGVYGDRYDDEANYPGYSLFASPTYKFTKTIGYRNVDGETYEVRLFDEEPYYINRLWNGSDGSLYDGFPKVQLHSDGNKGVDGKNILLRFNGFKETKSGYFYTGGFSPSSEFTVNYLLSDDLYMLKEYADGKNCYYDNPNPAVGGPGGGYITVLTELPSFTVSKYNYDGNSDKYPAIISHNFNEYTIYPGSADVVIMEKGYRLSCVMKPSTGQRFPYVSLSGSILKPNHRYLLLSLVDATETDRGLLANTYACPNIVGSVVVSRKTLKTDAGVKNNEQMLLSIVDMTTIPTNIMFSPMSSNDLTLTAKFDTNMMGIYDLTEMGMGDISNAEVAASMLGFGVDNINGIKYEIEETSMFGKTRELYIPETEFGKNPTVYDRYWKGYIADVYSVNTRVMECYCFLDNTDNTFRRFYLYDNALWILSKVTDWVSEDKVCKATFIKVNDKHNYTGIIG